MTAKINYVMSKVREGETLAIVVRDRVTSILCPGKDLPKVQHEWFTPSESQLQVGQIALGAGARIDRHYHPESEKTVKGAPEVLLIAYGWVQAVIFDHDLEIVDRLHLKTHDVLILLGGGHSFYSPEASSLLEIKQGPMSPLSKVRF